MAVSDAEYLLWLAGDRKNRIALVEAQCYSGGGVVTRYMSNGAFVSEPADSPANIPYEDFLASVPQFTQKLAEAFSGQSVPSWGEILITNESGVRDSWLDDAWDGRSVKIYLGDPTWPKSDFRKILDGLIEDIYAKDQRTLALKVRDKQFALNVPAQTSLIGGSTANAGLPIPLCYGPCKNVEPVLVDAATHEYQFGDGESNDVVQVYDNGIAVAGFTKFLSTSKFRLTTAPAGRVTADVQGSKVLGVYLTKCADIMQDLITRHTLLTTSDLDAASFTAFNTLCPQTMNLYVRNRENLIPVLDSLAKSLGAFYGFSRDGLMQLGRLEAPTGTAVLDIVADDVEQNQQFRVKSRSIPVTTIRLGYAKNWTVMTDGIDGTAAESRRAELGAEYLVATATDGSVLTAHLLAGSPDLEGTLIAGQADCAAEATRRLALHGVIRKEYGYDGFGAPFRVSVGQVINLTHPRYGFSAGAKAVVIRMREQPTNNRLSLDFWK